MRLVVLISALFLFSRAACADLIEGKVVHIVDGDTIDILVEHQPVRIRLTEIDAPERKQAFGKRSQQSLGQLCAGKTAQITWTLRDRYKRILGRVLCDGVDANAEQLRRGMAWVFDRYVKDRSLYQLQYEAKAARIGLWSDPQPIPPWDWRATKNKAARQNM